MNYKLFEKCPKSKKFLMTALILFSTYLTKVKLLIKEIMKI